ncbi:MAG: NAD-dependent epimerase/dehydratase family protein, partial [bacterium]|nr:NAD-dependent epimerase/dehydratase family protein [bacterium]
MKILVLGGTRFIGAFTVRRLVELGHRVTVFHRGKTNSSILPDVEHVNGDRKNLDTFRDTFKKMSPDVVLDMISFVQSDAQNFMTTFRGITSRAILISSGDVYRAFGIMLGTEQGPP